jgi:energy-coupling factor transporter ATP-binding protein EcfA2
MEGRRVLMQIITGKIKKAQKVVIYGPEGIGKSTFAAKFPQPLFLDTEGSTAGMDVPRAPQATSWTMLRQQIDEVKKDMLCTTLIIDTIDWAEQMCVEHILAKYQKSGIEDFGYGNGYVYVKEEFGRFLNQLQEVIDKGINVVLTAHAQMRKFEQPDELGQYDRYELKLGKKTSSQTSPLVKEWADMVLFANYKTYVINVDGQGAQKGKNKAQGGKRVMYTTHHTCWDAKNRHELSEELPFEYSAIAYCIPTGEVQMTTEYVKHPDQKLPVNTPPVNHQDEPKRDERGFMNISDGIDKDLAFEEENKKVKAEQNPQNRLPSSNIPKALADLMEANRVTVKEIQKAVASRGYYPEDTPIENYDPGFVSGVLVGAWQAVYGMIKSIREKSGQFAPADPDEIPFN